MTFGKMITVGRAKNRFLSLKRRVAKDRAMYGRLYQETTGAAKERAFGECNVCTQVMTWIDQEIAKLEE